MEKAQVLIVKDDAITAMDIENQLKNLGYGVSAKVAYGEEAIQKAKENTPDLVLMDIVLKGEMDGIKAAEEIRTQFDIPVIFLTAFADKDRLKRAKLANPFGFILKPFQNKDLSVTIEMALYVAKVDAERRKTEEKFRTLFDNASDAIFIHDFEGKIFEVNKAACDRLGYSYDELLQMTPRDFNSPEQASLIPERLKEFRQKGEIRFETFHKGRNGRVMPVEIVSQSIEYHGEQTVISIARDIPIRKQEEETLRESEERFRTVFDNAATGMALMANDGYFMKVNQTLCRILGYSDEELKGKTWVEITSPDDLPGCYDWLKRVKAGEQSSHEKRFIHKLGHPVWIEVSSSLVRDSQGRIQYYISLFQDIMSRKQAEEALRESEEKYRSMMESMKSAVYICSPDFRVEYMNPVMIKRTGRDATGEVCHKAVNDLDEQCPWCAHDKIQQGESAETEMLSPKDKRYYNISHSPIFHQDGSISQMTIYRDRTESKQVEEERIRLATAIEHAAESVIIASRPGTIQYVNPSFEQLSGYTQEEIVGQNFRILKSDKHNENFYKEMWDIISKGNVWSGRITNRMKDGTPREFETRISPVRDSSGEIINFVSVNRDVTQEVALEAQLQQSQKMKAIGTLAGGIAHDFNNILAAIMGFTELALNNAEKKTSLHDSLQQVMTAGKRAKDLVQQILTFSRQSEHDLKPVYVKFIAKETLKLLRASLPATVEIRQNIQNDSVVMADPTQIHQILMNLYTNAGHAMQENGGTLDVNLTDVELDSDFTAKHPGLKPGPYLKLTVSDTGHGIPPEVWDRIFDPFFTTKEKEEGTGMGLAVVHGIVKNHGGTISVYSEPGKGTTFNVFLPVIEKKLEPETGIEKPVPSGTERILFIDDEQTLTDLGKQMLEPLGYDVATRTSSIEALELFKNKPDRFALVITDLTMPKMSGDELAQKIMAIRPDIPVILCTGFSARMDDKKARAMGIRAFLYKPLIQRDMAESIRKVLDGN